MMRALVIDNGLRLEQELSHAHAAAKVKRWCACCKRASATPIWNSSKAT